MARFLYLPVQQQVRKENMQSVCKCHDWDTISTPFDPLPIMTAKAEDVKIPAIC